MNSFCVRGMEILDLNLLDFGCDSYITEGDGEKLTQSSYLARAYAYHWPYMGDLLEYLESDWSRKERRCGSLGSSHKTTSVPVRCQNELPLTVDCAAVQTMIVLPSGCLELGSLSHAEHASEQEIPR